MFDAPPGGCTAGKRKGPAGLVDESASRLRRIFLLDRCVVFRPTQASTLAPVQAITLRRGQIGREVHRRVSLSFHPAPAANHGRLPAV